MLLYDPHAPGFLGFLDYLFTVSHVIWKKKKKRLTILSNPTIDLHVQFWFGPYPWCGWMGVGMGGGMCVVREELRIFLSLCRMRISICEVEKWKRACDKAMKKRLRC